MYELQDGSIGGMVCDEFVNGSFKDLFYIVNARLVAAEQRAAVAEHHAQMAENRAQQLADSSAGRSPERLVDTRVLGRVREFKGVRKDWQDWSWVFRAFLTGANPKVKDVVDKAAASDQELLLSQMPPESATQH
eukprot:1983091-Amphidinium_carterae.2